MLLAQEARPAAPVECAADWNVFSREVLVSHGAGRNASGQPGAFGALLSQWVLLVEGS